MLPQVQQAIAELDQHFAGSTIETEDEEQGGAYVVVHDVDIGDQFSPQRLWIGFLIPYLYPDGDVYPHFCNPDLRRVDGIALGPAFQPQQNWRGRPAIQISRRSNHWHASTHTAAYKLMQVVAFIKEVGN